MRHLLQADFFIETATAARSEVSRQARLGQFLTSPGVADFMAGMFDKFGSRVNLLDAGAGAGALTQSFARRWHLGRAPGSKLHVTAYELDEDIQSKLGDCLDCLRLQGIDISLITEDFVERAATMIRLGRSKRFSHAILNPPYKKISNASAHRRHLRAAGLETVNLYSGFVGLSLELLEQGGEMVAIIPRSFCNGPYYEPFRRFMFDRAALHHIHLFRARNKAFKSDGVLQENVILHLKRGVRQDRVTISTSTDDSFADLEKTSYPFDAIVSPRDAARFIHIPSGEDLLLLRSKVLRHSLADIGVQVSTGPIVDFRMKEHLRANPTDDTVPLLYPGHFAPNALIWPKPGFKKPNAIAQNAATQKWLHPVGFYAVVRRFSSKEEAKRVVANVVDPARLPHAWLAFENHLNLFHQNRSPLPEELARGLTVYLNSTPVDRFFRQFNGHTQVNATDLRRLRYPDRDTLASLGQWAKLHGNPCQQETDEKVIGIA